MGRMGADKERENTGECGFLKKTSAPIREICGSIHLAEE
jgi:hypothetical protein